MKKRTTATKKPIATTPKALTPVHAFLAILVMAFPLITVVITTVPLLIIVIITVLLLVVAMATVRLLMEDVMRVECYYDEDGLRVCGPCPEGTYGNGEDGCLRMNYY